MENRNDPAADRAASEELERTRQAAKEQLERAKDAGREQLETGKDDVADRTDTIADAVDSAGYELHRQGQQTLASYAGDFAQSLSSFADRLRTSSVDELASEAQALARRNPGLFVLGSIGVGLVLGRFLKASSRRQHEDTLDAGAEEPDEYGAGYSDTSAGSSTAQSSYAAGSSPPADSAGVAASSDEGATDAPSAGAPASAPSASPQTPRERDSSYTDRTTGGL